MSLLMPSLSPLVAAPITTGGLTDRFGAGRIVAMAAGAFALSPAGPSGHAWGFVSLSRWLRLSLNWRAAICAVADHAALAALVESII